MLFRPNYCANCGERIERTDWGPLTSRRFCAVCESEFKGHDLIPRALVGVSLVIGLLGIGAYMKAGSVAPSAVTLSERTRVASPTVAARPPAANPSQPSPEPQTPVPASGKGVSDLRPVASVPRIEAADEAYICGAETKKGAPCSRRVKGNVRCYQHQGMPAMLPANKLKIS